LGRPELRFKLLYCAVPDSAAVLLPAEVVLTESVAFLTPVAWVVGGWNRTVTVQVPFGASVMLPAVPQVLAEIV